MSNETVYTGKSFYGGHYPKDSKDNIGRGASESTAIEALKIAQNKSKKVICFGSGSHLTIKPTLKPLG
jgi:hypothetical protein